MKVLWGACKTNKYMNYNNLSLYYSNENVGDMCITVMTISQCKNFLTKKSLKHHNTIRGSSLTGKITFQNLVSGG